MGNLKDFATSTILTPPSPADSGTTIVLQAGHGARFPAAPFMVTVHPPAEFPTLDNAEKLEVTAKSTDTLTVLRAQGSTTAKSIEAGWRISNALFLADIPVINSTAVDAAGATMNTDTDVKANGWVIDEDTMSSNVDTKVPTQQSVKAYVDSAIATAVSAAKQALYPVGSIYANYTSSTNPATLLGFGTWTAIEGRVLVGKAPSGTFATAGSTGGAETHTLSVAEMPSHTHTQNAHSHPLTPGGNILGGGGGTPAGLGGGAGWVYNIQSAASVTATNKNTGGGGAHNNLQPYVVVYMWQRTA